VSHASALLSGGKVAAIQADLADPAALTAHSAVADLIEPDQPTGLILALVLHFFDAPAAEKIMADLTDWAAPGSYVVMSVGSGDETTGGALTREYKSGPLRNHPPEQVAAFLNVLDLLPPCLVDARSWQPDAPAGKARQHQGGRILAGVSRKPCPAATEAMSG
jgi:hypothetical protein